MEIEKQHYGSTNDNTQTSYIDKLLGFSNLNISDEEKISYLKYFNTNINVSNLSRL